MVPLSETTHLFVEKLVQHLLHTSNAFTFYNLVVPEREQFKQYKHTKHPQSVNITINTLITCRIYIYIYIL